MISHDHSKRELPCLKVEVGRTGFQEVKLGDVGGFQQKNSPQHEVSNKNFTVEFEGSKGSSELVMKIFYRPTQECSEKCRVKVMYGSNITKIYEI